MSLLLRLYDPERGIVQIDNQIYLMLQESLRKQIGMVTQKTALFNRSARDNILYGKSSASFKTLVEASKKQRLTILCDLQDHQRQRV